MQTYVTRVLENSQVYANFSLCKAFFMKLGASLTFVKRAATAANNNSGNKNNKNDDDDDYNNNDDNNNNDNNNHHIQRRSSRFFTISSLCRELSPTRTL